MNEKNYICGIQKKNKKQKPAPQMTIEWKQQQSTIESNNNAGVHNEMRVFLFLYRESENSEWVKRWGWFLATG